MGSSGQIYVGGAGEGGVDGRHRLPGLFLSFPLKMWLLAQSPNLNRWQLQFSRNFLKEGKPLEFISAFAFPYK